MKVSICASRRAFRCRDCFWRDPSPPACSPRLPGDDPLDPLQRSQTPHDPSSRPTPDRCRRLTRHALVFGRSPLMSVTNRWSPDLGRGCPLRLDAFASASLLSSVRYNRSSPRRRARSATHTSCKPPSSACGGHRHRVARRQRRRGPKPLCSARIWCEGKSYKEGGGIATPQKFDTRGRIYLSPSSGTPTRIRAAMPIPPPPPRRRQVPPPPTRRPAAPDGSRKSSGSAQPRVQTHRMMVTVLPGAAVPTRRRRPAGPARRPPAYRGALTGSARWRRRRRPASQRALERASAWAWDDADGQSRERLRGSS